MILNNICVISQYEFFITYIFMIKKILLIYATGLCLHTTNALNFQMEDYTFFVESRTDVKGKPEKSQIEATKYQSKDLGQNLQNGIAKIVHTAESQYNMIVHGLLKLFIYANFGLAIGLTASIVGVNCDN